MQIEFNFFNYKYVHSFPYAIFFSVLLVDEASKWQIALSQSIWNRNVSVMSAASVRLALHVPVRLYKKST